MPAADFTWPRSTARCQVLARDPGHRSGRADHEPCGHIPLLTLVARGVRSGLLRRTKMSPRALTSVIVLGVAGTLFVAVVGGAQPGKASARTFYNGVITFSSDRDGNREIYSMLADGTFQTRLTNLPSDDTSPSWAPDGRMIAFATDRDGDWEIYTMLSDGSGLFDVSDSPTSVDLDPDWSPDGTKIAFRSARGGNSDLLRRHPRSVGMTNLTNDRAWANTTRHGRQTGRASHSTARTTVTPTSG